LVFEIKRGRWEMSRQVGNGRGSRVETGIWIYGRIPFADTVFESDGYS